MTGNVALFSHGEFGVALAARWIGLPVVKGQHFSLVTASLNILGYNPSHPIVRVIALWNATPALCASSV
jgi:broad specificity phosphatase PhoE